MHFSFQLDDPVERPPEPTVPDERVDTTSEEEEEDNQDTPPEQNQGSHLKPGNTVHSGPGGAVRKDTTAAISDLLSDIVSAPEVAIAGER